ncbi:hypothetical protein L7F22_016023 [Adiantum nelumboides]|nr:hypothetical protein [Adiantum nelumboides]
MAWQRALKRFRWDVVAPLAALAAISHSSAPLLLEPVSTAPEKVKEPFTGIEFDWKRNIRQAEAEGDYYLLGTAVRCMLGQCKFAKARAYAVGLYAESVDEDPYSRLSEDISHYTSLGEVLLMGDFNGRTQSRQCEIYDMEQLEIMRALDAEDMGVSRLSADGGQDNTGYGRYLLELGSRHHLVIYNGMAMWPDSGGFTCFPHSGGESTVDYLMGSTQTSELIHSVSIARTPIGADHTYLTSSLLATHLVDPLPSPTHTYTTISFTHELTPVYIHHLHEHLIHLDPTTPLDTLTTDITSILHESATQSFPHRIHTHPPRTGTMPQNRWYDDECRNLHRHLRILEIRGEITHHQAQRKMRTLTRRKRREWEEHQYWDIYHLLMSQDCVEAWRRIRPPRPSTPIQDPATWHRYAESCTSHPWNR